ncbi:hypothetical protein HI914_03193 [Erysiphe necator]|nr:hypothetical protein HI914_03193 [Erysiphe necator]
MRLIYEGKVCNVNKFVIEEMSLAFTGSLQTHVINFCYIEENKKQLNQVPIASKPMRIQSYTAYENTTATAL